MEGRRAGRGADQTRRATKTGLGTGAVSASNPQTFRSWFRQAVTQEKDRAGVRDLLRDTQPTFAREGARRASLSSSSLKKSSIYSNDAFDDSSFSSDDAVGPFDAGDPTADMDKHHCELPSDIEKEPCPPLPVHPTMVQVIQKYVLPYIIIWEDHPRSRESLRSLASIRREQRRHARSRHWYMVHPMCILRIWWEPFVAIIMVLSLIIEPLDEAFRYSEDGIWSTVIFFLRFICLLDCLLNFFTGYHIVHENTTVLTPRLIARRYLRSTFLLDIVATINISWIFSIPSYDITPLLIIIDFVRLTRLRIVHRNLTNFMVIFGYSMNVATSILLIMKFLAVIHCLSMINWYAIRVCCSKRDLAEMVKPACNNSWITIARLWNNPNLLKYVHCLHRTTVLLLRTNMPQGPPHTGVDTCVVILNSAVGAITMIYLFLNTIFLRLSKEYTQIIYEQIMVVVHNYADFKKLTPELKERLLIFYEYSFARTSFDETVIRNNLSRSLRFQVKQHSFREAVRLSGLFRGLPRSVCTSVVQHLNPVVLMRGDVFIRYGDPCEAMFFVQHGGLAIVTVTGLEAEHLQDGDFFGEDGLMQSGGKHSATVVALETSVVLRLERRDFNRVLEAFPPLARRIRRCSQRRQEVLRLAALQISEAFSSDEDSAPTTPTDTSRTALG